MRIISGKYKGRRLNPKGLKFTRPTTDFAKEGIFNILYHQFNLEGVEVLDLFAGTGSISFEFLSRGASSVVSVENNTECVKFIAESKEMLSADEIEIVRNDSMRYLDKCTYKFDIIFADPPFQSHYAEEIPKIVMSRQLLKSGGLLIVEHDKRKKLEHLEGFEETRQFGNVYFSIFHDNQGK